MAVTDSTANKQPTLVVRRDFGSVRNLIRRLKISVRFADLCLFSCRAQAQTVDHIDSRGLNRSGMGIPIYVKPVAFDGRHIEPLEDSLEEILAVTMDVTRSGACFIHDEPLAGDYAIAFVDLLDGCPVSMLLEVLWSKSKMGDSYTSGGRFVSIAGTAERRQVGKSCGKCRFSATCSGPPSRTTNEVRRKSKEAGLDGYRAKLGV